MDKCQLIARAWGQQGKATNLVDDPMHRHSAGMGGRHPELKGLLQEDGEQLRLRKKKSGDEIEVNEFRVAKTKIPTVSSLKDVARAPGTRNFLSALKNDRWASGSAPPRWVLPPGGNGGVLLVLRMTRSSLRPRQKVAACFTTDGLSSRIAALR